MGTQLFSTMVWAKAMNVRWLFLCLLLLDCARVPVGAETGTKTDKLKSIESKKPDAASADQNAQRNSVPGGGDVTNSSVSVDATDTRDGTTIVAQSSEESDVDRVQYVHNSASSKLQDASRAKTKHSASKATQNSDTTPGHVKGVAEKTSTKPDAQVDTADDEGFVTVEEDGEVTEKSADPAEEEEAAVVVDASNNCDNATLYNVQIDFTSTVIENGELSCVLMTNSTHSLTNKLFTLKVCALVF